MMPSDEYIPITIEQLILNVKNNTISAKVLIQAMLDIDFYIACDEKVLASKKIILPICVEMDNEKNVCVFTQKNLAEIYMSPEVSVVKLQAKQWLKQHLVN
jgi:hypothetical protein